MNQQFKDWRQGDTLSPLAVTLKQENAAGVLTAINLTGLTVEVQVVDGSTGDVLVEPTTTGVSVTTAASGECQYTLADAAVAEPGYRWITFIVTSGGKADSFPVRHNDLQLRVCGLNVDAKTAYEGGET